MVTLVEFVTAVFATLQRYDILPSDVYQLIDIEMMTRLSGFTNEYWSALTSQPIIIEQIYVSGVGSMLGATEDN